MGSSLVAPSKPPLASLDAEAGAQRRPPPLPSNTSSEWRICERPIAPTPREGFRLVALLAVFGFCLWLARLERPRQKIHKEEKHKRRNQAELPSLDLTSVAAPLEGRGFAALVQTAFDTGDRLTRKADVPFVGDVEGEMPTIQIGSVVGEPGLVGFGGAFTEASAVVFQGLRPELQQQFLEHYFGPEGLGYSVGRVHINSCDFSLSSYSFDDTDGDFELAHFDNFVTRDTKALIPLIKAARKMLKDHGRNISLFASPWSPPAWMKTNRQMDGTWDPCLREDARATWAQYMSRWLTAYKNHGVEFWGVTVQNEPEWNDTRYEQCHYSPREEADFLGSFLGPVLRAAHPELKIMVFDHNKHDVPQWADTLYSHAAAAPFVDGVAFHWYTGDYFQNVRHVRKNYPSAVLLPTEATFTRDRWKNGDRVEEGQWDFGEGYAHDIMGDLNAGASGWVDWNLLLDEHGGPNHAGNTCDAAVRANLSAQQIYLHPQYYFMGHFSKYIPSGSKRLALQMTSTSQYSGPPRPFGTCTAADGLQSTAFLRPDGQVVAVVLNCGDSSLRFKLQDGPARAIDALIPPHAIQTYLFEQGDTWPQ